MAKTKHDTVKNAISNVRKKPILGVLSGTGAIISAKEMKSKADNSDLDFGKIAPVGVGLMTGEKVALKAIAEEHGLTLNAIMRFALRRFIVEVRSGELDISEHKAKPEPAKERLELPS